MLDPGYRYSPTVAYRPPGLRYEKRIGETKSAFIWDRAAPAGKLADSETTPGHVPPSEGEIEQRR
jgi:hypothetical protein